MFQQSFVNLKREKLRRKQNCHNLQFVRPVSFRVAIEIFSDITVICESFVYIKAL